MRQFELEIARRLALGRAKGKSSPAVKVAEVSVALSIAVMIIAIGVVFGFKREITRKIMGVNPQITLYAALPDDDGRAVLLPDEGIGELLDSLPYVASWKPTVNTLALLKTKDNFKGIYLTGLSERCDTAFLSENLISGHLPDFRNSDKESRSLLLSQNVADELSLKAGDSISVYSFGNSVMLKRLEVTGIYDTHLDMFDDMLAFAPIPTAASLGGYQPGEATRIDVTVKDPDPSRIPDYASALHADLSDAIENGSIDQSVGVDNIYNQCKGIFGWLGMLDTNVWVILSLLTLVSAFTLISGMLIIILEKVRFIGVMKALGASSASIRRVFIWLAMRIGVRGMVAGTVIGLVVLTLQYYLHIVRLNADAYYMDYAPVDFVWWAFGLTEAAFAVIIYLVLTIPSRLVSRISPSESMRFE